MELNYSFNMEDLIKEAKHFPREDYKASALIEKEQREEMLQLFPKDNWKEMSLKNYSLGQEDPEFDRSNYSYYLEFKSLYLGRLGGGSATKHMIYWSKTNNEWKYRQKYGSAEEAWQIIRDGFVKLFNYAENNEFDKIDHIDSFAGNASKLKTLYLYYPDEFLPVNSIQIISNVTKALGLEETAKKMLRRKLGATLNRLILKEIRKNTEFENWSTNEIWMYIWYHFMNNELTINVDPLCSLDMNLEEISEKYPTLLEIKSALERKNQLILYGPAGTGKTYYARKFINWWLHCQLDKKQNPLRILDDKVISNQVETELKNKSYSEMITFHPSYTYEDFIEGYKPVENQNSLQLSLQKGIFYILCDKARAKPNDNFVLLIDEINRADIAKVFGELITVMEKNKRGMSVKLPQSKKLFSIPPNLYLIGTMNTSDASIKSLDIALRRRFAFIEMAAQPELLDAVLNGLDLEKFLSELNKRIKDKLSREKQIGHAYFMDGDYVIDEIEDFREVFIYEILPLIEEHTYNDYDVLVEILGTKLVDVANQRFRSEIMEKPIDLIDVLKAEFL